MASKYRLQPCKQYVYFNCTFEYMFAYSDVPFRMNFGSIADAFIWYVRTGIMTFVYSVWPIATGSLSSVDTGGLTALTWG